MSAKSIYPVTDVSKTVLGLPGVLPKNTTYLVKKPRGSFFRKVSRLQEIKGASQLALTPTEDQVGLALYVTFTTVDDEGSKLYMSYKREANAPEPSLQNKYSLGIGCELNAVTTEYVESGQVVGPSYGAQIVEAFFSKFLFPATVTEKQIAELTKVLTKLCEKEVESWRDEGGDETNFYTSSTSNCSWLALHIQVDVPYNPVFLQAKYKGCTTCIKDEWISSDIQGFFAAPGNASKYDDWSQQIAPFIV